MFLERCLLCGKTLSILPGDKSKLFCSPKCNRKFHKLLQKGKIEYPEIEPYSFKCSYCGREVEIKDIRDKRTKFCCDRCQRNYWGCHGRGSNKAVPIIAKIKK